MTADLNNPLFLHQLLQQRRIKEPPLNYLLTKLVRELKGSFCGFVDGGAGIGHTSKQFAKLLVDNLPPELHQRASVVCYEPLPENFEKLKENTASTPICRLRMAALANAKGKSSFFVGTRMKAGGGAWSEGTSFGGFLIKTPMGEMIEVETVRLEDDVDVPIDFIKLDLQGGELEALRGMGPRLQEANLLYIESQLLTPTDEGCRAFIKDNGFVVFPDLLQFGFKGQRDIPLGLVADLGLETTRLYLPDGSGMPHVLWGYFNLSKNIFDPSTLRITPAAVEKLKAAGCSYVQTDLLCVNRKILPVVEKHLINMAG